MTGPSSVRPFVTRRWRALAGAGGASVAIAAADLAKPWPLALVIDRLVRGREGAFDLGGDVELLALIAALVIAIALVDAVAQYCADLWLQSAGERITHELRVAAYSHLQRLSLGYHQRSQKGDLLTRITGDVNAVGTLFSDSIGAMTQDALILTGMVVVVFVLDPLLGLVAIAMLPALATVSWVYRRRVRAQSRLQRAQEGRIASIAGEALAAMPVVKAFGSERYENERIRSRSEERMATGVEVARLQARFDGLVGVLTAIGTALVIVVGVVRVASGDLSLGGLIVFASYARKAQAPLRRIAREATKVAKALARAERIGEVLSADELVEERPHAYSGPRAQGDLRLDDVTFAYERNRPALHGVSLSIAAGERVAVIGPSGSGKSTLAALVARFYDPARGSLCLDGRDLRDCSLPWLRDQVGLLLQDTVLFTGTLAENIAYGSVQADRERIVAAARAAAADDFVASLPAGYDTELGPQGVGLSGGQRQRIGIARTLLRDPALLVLDEPTTGLDRDNEARVMDGLAELMRDRTTIVITHSLELARGADRVVVMRDGRIAADGAPAEVIGDKDAFRRLADGEERGAARPIATPAPTSAATPAPAADPALPQLRTLLDPGTVAAAVRRSLPAAAELRALEVGRVGYSPGERLSVHWRCEVDGEGHDLVATGVANADLAAIASKRRYAEMARSVAGRTPGSEPLRYDAELDALITWLPLDPRLPALLEPGPRLLERLASAGVDVAADAAEPRRIGYKPRARAVLRLDGHVLKAYGSRRRFDAARCGLRAAAQAHGVPTARFEAELPDLRATVQAAVDGVTPPQAAGAAARAGGLARRLHGSPLEGLEPAHAERELRTAERKAAVVKAVLPDLGPRLDELLAELRASTPPAPDLVPAHGDFHVDQLLDRDGELLLVDFDDLRLAPPALDLATYAADVVRGRPGDGAAVAAVTEPLLDGYDERPAHFDWHLAAAILGRAAHPFQRQVPGWPERVASTIHAAEEALHR